MDMFTYLGRRILRNNLGAIAAIIVMVSLCSFHNTPDNDTLNGSWVGTIEDVLGAKSRLVVTIARVGDSLYGQFNLKGGPDLIPIIADLRGHAVADTGIFTVLKRGDTVALVRLYRVPSLSVSMLDKAERMMGTYSPKFNPGLPSYAVILLRKVD